MHKPACASVWLLSLVLVVGFSTSCSTLSVKQETLVLDALAEGALFLAEGQFGEAAGIYLATLQDVPDDVRLLYNLGLAQAQADDFKSAIATISTLVRLFPENVKYLRAQAAILQASGASKEACAVWEQVLVLDPYNQVVRLRLANQYFSDSEFKLSQTHASTLYRKGQYSRELYLLLGRLQQSMGEGDGASWSLLADAYFPQVLL